MNWGKLGLFAGGVLFGTAGLKILGSRDAKKVYVHTTAAALRAKDCVMDAYTDLKEECGDIYAEAQAINDRRVAQAAEEIIEDTAEEAAEA